jgi:hypothetical protein
MVMRALLVRSASRVLALAIVVAACAEKAPLPPQLQDCDAGKGCGTVTTGGGVGTGGPPTDSGGASCGTIRTGDPTCDACVKGMCCDQDAACTANLDCVELVRCVGGCRGDQACVLACRNKSQNGIGDYDKFIKDCVGVACTDACAGSEAGANCGVLVFPTTACNTCADSHCCSQSAACSNNPDCFALTQCAAPCGANTQCVMDCSTHHPNGSPDYTSLQQCLQLNCANACQ